MLERRIKNELEKAVCEGNVQGVKSILSTITDFSDEVKEDLGLFLHYDAIDVRMARELLLFGADARTFNNLRDSPLHSAIANRKEPELIKLLLQHGSNIDASNFHGSTPLYVALKKINRNLAVIQVLLEYGADINILNRERRVYGNHYSALEFSMFDLSSAELLVKYTVLRNFDNDYRKIVDLEPFKEYNNYCRISDYFNDCVLEITQMKMDFFHGSWSLCDLLFLSDSSRAVLYRDLEITSEKFFQGLFCNSYPIYSDIIMSSEILRICLMDKLSKIKICSKASSFVKDAKEWILLDVNSICLIAKYLSNEEILYLIRASFQSS